MILLTAFLLRPSLQNIRRKLKLIFELVNSRLAATSKVLKTYYIYIIEYTEQTQTEYYFII